MHHNACVLSEGVAKCNTHRSRFRFVCVWSPRDWGMFFYICPLFFSLSSRGSAPLFVKALATRGTASCAAQEKSKSLDVRLHKSFSSTSTFSKHVLSQSMYTHSRSRFPSAPWHLPSLIPALPENLSTCTSRDY